MTKDEIQKLEKKWTELLKGPKRSKAPKVNNKIVTAAKLQAQLQQDEEYQKWYKESEQVRIALEAAFNKEHESLIDELKVIGIEIESIWDLVNTKSSYEKAIPILINHLTKDYHIKNKEGIVRALAVKKASGIACKAIINEYGKAPKDNNSYRWAFGNTMAEIFTDDFVDQVIEIVLNEENGESRHMFVTALGKSKSPKIKEPLQKLLSDKDKTISKEAEKVLKKIK